MELNTSLIYITTEYCDQLNLNFYYRFQSNKKFCNIFFFNESLYRFCKCSYSNKLIKR